VELDPLDGMFCERTPMISRSGASTVRAVTSKSGWRAFRVITKDGNGWQLNGYSGPQRWSAVVAGSRSSCVHEPIGHGRSANEREPMLLVPRHTPRIGSLPAKCLTTSTLMPASRGRARPGRDDDVVGAFRLDLLQRDLIVRYNLISRVRSSSPMRCTRL